MKKIYYFTVIFCFIFSLFAYQSVYADVFRYIRVGNYHVIVVDSKDESMKHGSYRFHYYYDDFRYGLYSTCGHHVGGRDWYDENGVYWPVKVANAIEGANDELYNTMPLPDEEGITIRRYFRYKPPTITVDGWRLDEPFPRMGDEVAPDKIPGTADVMVESFIRTMYGVNQHQTVLAWSQHNHDDYVINDWTMTNTGNVDLDDEVELPDQILKDVYFMKDSRPCGAPQGWRPKLFFSCFGEYPADSMRMVYSYSARQETAKYDDCGRRDSRNGGFLREATYNGMATLYADKSVNDHSNDPSQPQMTSVGHPEWPFVKHEANTRSPAELLQLYDLIRYGNKVIDGTPEIPEEETYPGTHHSVRMEERVKFTTDLGYAGRGKNRISFGPYPEVKPGDYFRIVWADLAGGISPEIGWNVGNSWENQVDIEPPPGMVFGVTDNLSPQYKNYPELYAEDYKSSEYNNWARNCWIFTGKDTIFRNCWNANWNFQNNYDIPIAPPPPSIEINSRPDKVDITWGSESESASDFAGYRVYRAMGNPGAKAVGDKLQGMWELVFECGDGTANALTHNYEDMAAERGQAYYYYVSAFDDGLANKVDVNGKRESLESGKYLNRTTLAAYLTRPAGTSLNQIRVVPNPFNINAEELQYVGEPNKIMFLDLPGYCTIKIYSESGDLVKTLVHDDGSGDESWGVLLDEHSTTETGQLIVSGIYIALIEENNEDGTSTGNRHFVKFVVVR